ncbi:MAG: hypothetical protein QGI83_18105 [Candidatus Latescibacteria bacterium]|jgi:hypothetical protein|nr:hypothetical protein [Candidatus Latescibacterota bacterium]
MPDKEAPKPGRRRLRELLKDPAVVDRALRATSIGLILVLVGGCVVLLLAFVMELAVVVVAVGGIGSMVLASYVFIRLWPQEEESPSRVSEVIAEALEEPEPKPLSPEEYRIQRERAQKMIAQKAAPILAKAIRGILRQEEQRRGRR